MCNSGIHASSKYSGFAASLRITRNGIGETLTFLIDPIKSAQILSLDHVDCTINNYFDSVTLRERRGGFVERGLKREGYLEDGIIGDIFDDLMLIILWNLVVLL